ncbi:DUF4136 domain-containing protein [Thalassotalea sp. ND16A]|uniref:DUF4136 domain-containing protein n=1 Tax=Thalassotalea sp. ND16A TaxID=1535422 RepID=UPI00051A26CA|nr:DUF4136 domain-containing protein [Thalassotalea sp. ND16A]KGJ98384.1 hypothetical protein ND16A_0693 [Thalassotalea sp. ND16A]
MNYSDLKSALFILLLSSCATTYYPDVDFNPEYNFSQLQTFVVFDSYPADQSASKTLNRTISDLDNERVIKAITSNLQQKGMTTAEVDNADMQVRFQLVTKDRTRLTTYNSGYYQCWRCRGAYGMPAPITEVDIREYVEGTMIIDFVDPKLGKSVWRSVVTKALPSKVPVDEKQEKTQQLINAMLASFKAPVTK